MPVSIRSFVFLLYFFCHPNIHFGQGSQTIQWQFTSDPASPDEVVIKFTAQILQGWHLYSQHIPEGGPIPTRFSFANTDDFILLGQADEKGKPTTFHDHTYDMEITWYTGTVSFLQKIKLLPQATFIKGTIEFMTCNEHNCIPSKQDFNVDVRSKKKTS